MAAKSPKSGDGKFDADTELLLQSLRALGGPKPAGRAAEVGRRGEAFRKACADTRTRSVRSLNCVHCFGSGWVCEDHMDRPSDVITEGGCDCGGAAAPCRCNPAASFNFAEVYMRPSMNHPDRTPSISLSAPVDEIARGNAYTFWRYCRRCRRLATETMLHST